MSLRHRILEYMERNVRVAALHCTPCLIPHFFELTIVTADPRPPCQGLTSSVVSYFPTHTRTNAEGGQHSGDRERRCVHES